MKTTLTLLAALLLFPMLPLHAQSSQTDAAGVGYAVASRLEEFLGEPLFVPMQQLWEKRGGWGGVLTAKDGTVVAFQSPGGGNCRRSRDGGKTGTPTSRSLPTPKAAARWWTRRRATSSTSIRPPAGSSAVAIRARPGRARAYRCGPTGSATSRRPRAWRPCSAASRSRSASTRAGSSCRRGSWGRQSSNAVEWRPYHYSTALYSDDGGAVWQTSKPFPVLGTGEAALAELSDGSILYNSREHMSRGNRFLAHSDDGGDLWIGAYRSPDLPDGAGHLLRPDGRHDPPAGRRPRHPPLQQRGHQRRRDAQAGRCVHRDGPRESDRLGQLRRRPHLAGQAARLRRPQRLLQSRRGPNGTPSQGKIYLLFEGGPKGCHEAVQVVSFNLSWLLNGRDITPLIGKTR